MSDDDATFGAYLEIEYATRTDTKPRSAGVTMVMDQGWPNAFTEGMLDAFGTSLDIVKLWDPHLRAPARVVRDKVKIYKDYGVIVQPGGLILELARQQDSYKRTLERLKSLGFDAVEISNTTSTRVDLDEETKAVRQALDMGFRIYGEVGRKFADGDGTRLNETTLDIDATVEEFETLLEAGAEKVYWEGHLLRKVMGDDPETINEKASSGTQQVIEVARRVGLDKIMFEVSGLRPRANRQWLQFWLVRVFGPDVNIANARIEEMANLEAIRAGSHPIFGFGAAGNYAWMRAYGEGRAKWWRS